MIIFKKAADITAFLQKEAAKGRTVGFVPTMGALHAGHISLIDNAKRQSDLTVCSIFINPTQFNNAQDFEKYPVTIESDIYKLEQAGCDVLFIPSVGEMYPKGVHEKVHFDLGYLEDILEGKSRPGHFQGVWQVVKRLLDIVHPNKLFLGRKDYQQCMVIQKLVNTLDYPIEVIKIDTLREPDGLAMSSRNLRLTEEDRKRAPTIYKVLTTIKENASGKDDSELTSAGEKELTDSGFKVDYVAIADADTLMHSSHVGGKKVALIAAYINNIRLIDNLQLS